MAGLIVMKNFENALKSAKLCLEMTHSNRLVSMAA